MRLPSWMSAAVGFGVLVAVGLCLAVTPSAADPVIPPPSYLPTQFEDVPVLGEIRPGGDDAPTGQNNALAAALEEVLMQKFLSADLPADGVRVDRETLAVTVEVPQAAGPSSPSDFEAVVDRVADGMKAARGASQQPVQLQLVPSTARQVEAATEALRPVVSAIAGREYFYVSPNLFEGRREIVILVDPAFKADVADAIASSPAHEVATVVLKGLDEIGAPTSYAESVRVLG